MKRSQNLSAAYRVPMLIAALICLAFGLVSGLLRIGWQFQLPSANLVAFHGPLMVCGFLGTVIALERAVAIGKLWAYFGPFAAALGGLAFILELNWQIGASLFTLASSILSVATLYILNRQRELFTMTLLLACLSWLIGNILWLYGTTIVQIVPWWMGFLVLTIAGERLELSRFLPTTFISKVVFMLIVTIFMAGAVIATFSKSFNVEVLSLALLTLALWLLRHDVARRTIKQSGLTRYVAICLMPGYIWLLFGGIVGILSPELMPGSSYDAFVHAIMVGFVFSMIFGHAPIIFPAVAKVRIPYHPSFYLPLIALHVSVIVRIAGDLLADPLCRGYGGALNGVALIMFILSTATAIIRSKWKKASAETIR